MGAGKAFGNSTIDAKIFTNNITKQRLPRALHSIFMTLIIDVCNYCVFVS